jgi:hypothetical protein
MQLCLSCLMFEFDACAFGPADTNVKTLHTTCCCRRLWTLTLILPHSIAANLAWPDQVYAQGEIVVTSGSTVRLALINT